MSRGLWFKSLLAAGAILAVALLAQTAVNYRYVSENLIRQEARRVASEQLRALERSARQARAQDVETFAAILEELRIDAPDLVAGIALFQTDGTLVAVSGQAPTSFQPQGLERRQAPSGGDNELRRELRDGRDVFAGTFLCRCGLGRSGGEAATLTPAPAGRLLVQLAVYRDGLSAPFSRLRRNAGISAAAALTLLLTTILIAFRVGPYVRGKQLESQMQLAREVQRDLLPARDAWPAGVDGGAISLPAWEIGGDFFDIAQVGGGRVAFSLGDVSGHGASAALLMSLIHGATSQRPDGAADEALDRTVARLNDLLLVKSSADRFATLITCLYDPRTGALQYVNAGHPPALWLQRDPNGSVRVERLTEGGPVLGLLSDASYQTTTIKTRPGDIIALFSDGILEAANGHEESFGEPRLLETIDRLRDRPVPEICQAVLAAVAAFGGKRAADDDRTVLMVRLWRDGDGRG